MPSLSLGCEYLASMRSCCITWIRFVPDTLKMFHFQISRTFLFLTLGRLAEAQCFLLFAIKNVDFLIDLNSFCELPIIQVYLSHLPSIKNIVAGYNLLSGDCQYTSQQLIALIGEHLHDCDEFASQQIVSFLAKHQYILPIV